MKDKKILISVLSLEEEPYISLEKTIRETWAKEKHSNIEIIYYYGGNSGEKFIEDKYYAGVGEGPQHSRDRHIGYKTLKMFEYCLNNMNFDYIFRTNSSSYLDIGKLITFISDKPITRFYSGAVGTLRDVRFASGSGYFISRDLVQLVLSNKDKWIHSLVDDVALGQLLGSMSVDIHSGQRQDITSTEQYIEGFYHYRVKCHNDRNGDIAIMKHIYNK